MSLVGKEPVVRVLLRSSASERICSPVWSPDGRRIAFSVGKKVEILDVEDGLVQRFGVETQLCEIWWSPEGSRLYFDSGCDIGELDLTSGTYRRLGLWKDHRNPLKGLPSDWPADPVFYSPGGCPNLPPRLTPGGRYYFRERVRDGWFAKSWIERCNTRTHHLFCVPIHTKWRALYSE